MSLSARTKELLEQARREAEPGPDDLRRLRAQLSTKLSTEEPALTAVPLAFLKVAGAVALAAAGLSAWQWLRPEKPAPPPITSAAVCPPSPECPAPTVAPACPPAPTAVPTPAAPACPPASKAAATAGPRPGAGGLRELSYTLPADDADRWALEVGLLVDARVALDEGRSLDALGHAQRHARLFPDSGFQEERLAVEVMATCQVGRPELAKSPLRALLALEPATTYLPRIRSACGWQDPAQTLEEQPDGE
ncbi:MAG: hypothetical protein MUC96_05865 [Myxococcaceae bacterium]|jgi:hypothetical protein|nr:hypothetical protein [Myxococcaceae bacterium]